MAGADDVKGIADESGARRGNGPSRKGRALLDALPDPKLNGSVHCVEVDSRHGSLPERSDAFIVQDGDKGASQRGLVLELQSDLEEV